MSTTEPTLNVTRWRKKPVEIEAVQWTGTNLSEVLTFTGPAYFGAVDPEDRAEDPEQTAEVYDKLHGTWVHVYDGQWIIRGVQGELYPIAADVLAATYEPAEPLGMAGPGDDDGRDRPTRDESAQDDTGPSSGELHEDLLESAWGVIANAGWNEDAKTTGWQEAAERWRDGYHRWLDLHLRPGGYQTWEELAAGLVRERDALFAEVAELRRALRDAASTKPVVVPDVTLARAEAAEAKLAKIEVHLPVVLDALRIAVASGGYEYERNRYRVALEALGGTEEETSDG